jgi:hypothetical protein
VPIETAPTAIRTTNPVAATPSLALFDNAKDMPAFPLKTIRAMVSCRPFFRWVNENLERSATNDRLASDLPRNVLH